MIELLVDFLRRGYAVRFQATGGSMAPVIRAGEHVLAEPAEASQLSHGDIVLFLTDGRVRAHRLVGVWRDAEGQLLYLLRGDALENCDRPVSADAILGRIVCVERRRCNVPLVKTTRELPVVTDEALAAAVGAPAPSDSGELAA